VYHSLLKGPLEGPGVLNWNVLSAAFEPYVCGFLTHPETPKPVKDAYFKLPYLDGIHSISLLAGDHALHAEFKVNKPKALTTTNPF